MFTPRQRQIARCLLSGYENPKIADQLEITIGSLKNHMKLLFEKIGCGSRVEFVWMVLPKAEWLEEIYRNG